MTAIVVRLRPKPPGSNEDCTNGHEEWCSAHARMVGGRHEEAAAVRQVEGVGARRGAEARSFARGGALQGHDGRRFVPLDQKEALAPQLAGALGPASPRANWACA